MPEKRQSHTVLFYSKSKTSALQHLWFLCLEKHFVCTKSLLLKFEKSATRTGSWRGFFFICNPLLHFHRLVVLENSRDASAPKHSNVSELRELLWWCLQTHCEDNDLPTTSAFSAKSPCFHSMYYPSPQYHRNLKMEIDFSRKALKPLDRIQNVQCVSHHCHIFWTELATQLVNFCCSCSSSTCVSNLGFVLLMHLEHILIILHTVPKPHLDESLDFWKLLDKNWTFNKVWFWWFWQQKSTFDSGHTFWSLEGRTNQMNFWNIYNLAAHCILRP